MARFCSSASVGTRTKAQAAREFADVFANGISFSGCGVAESQQKSRSDEDQSPPDLSGINKPGSHPSLNPGKKKKATKMLSSIVGFLDARNPKFNFSSLSANI